VQEQTPPPPPPNHKALPDKGGDPPITSIWTKENSKYKNGEPMLSEEDLNVAGHFFCQALHKHYMVLSAQGEESIGVAYHEYHFESQPDDFIVGFNDLYDLFKLEALDISLPRCFSLQVP